MNSWKLERAADNVPSKPQWSTLLSVLCDRDKIGEEVPIFAMNHRGDWLSFSDAHLSTTIFFKYSSTGLVFEIIKDDIGFFLENRKFDLGGGELLSNSALDNFGVPVGKQTPHRVALGEKSLLDWRLSRALHVLQDLVVARRLSVHKFRKVIVPFPLTTRRCPLSSLQMVYEDLETESFENRVGHDFRNCRTFKRTQAQWSSCKWQKIQTLAVNAFLLR